MLAGVAPASADELDRRGLSLSLGPEVVSFHQGSQGPPLCCGERDEWSATGVGGSVVAGYAVTSWFMPSLELGLGGAKGSESTEWRDLDVTLSTSKTVLRLDFFVGGPVAIAPHLGWYVIQVAGDFDDSAGRLNVDRSDQFMGPGVGLGIDARFSRDLGLRLDAAGAYVSAAADGSTWKSLSLRAVWWTG